MGPEPYTLAMLLRERIGHMYFRNVRIQATDIDGSDLFDEIIVNAAYPKDQVERIPPDLFEKYFVSDDQDGYFRLIDEIVKGGELLQIADRQFEVIHTPGHSSDSICLYCPAEKVLFAGDTPLIIRTKDNTYAPEFVQVLKYLVSKQIDSISFGHGEPLTEGCLTTIHTLENIQ